MGTHTKVCCSSLTVVGGAKGVLSIAEWTAFACLPNHSLSNRERVLSFQPLQFSV